jgi:predicted GIY-YIG superfamily endonuclease
MTANPVQYRYEQHKSGKKANRYAQLYGEGVIEELCKSLENMTREAAEKREQKLAINLRNKGYAVWQG